MTKQAGKMVLKAEPKSIMCWNCGSHIPVDELRCSGRAMSCPTCGAPLNEEEYDRAAKTLLLGIESTKAESKDVEQRIDALEKKLAKWGILGKIPFLPARKRLVALSASAADLDSQKKASRRNLRLLALARYHVSDWFRATRIPLRTSARDSAFGNPWFSLRKDGGVRFDCLDDSGNRKRATWARAHYAEYRAFEQVNSIVKAGKLGHCRLLAGLYVPYDEDPRQKYNKHIRYNEIDLLLVTTGAIVVVEVKRTTRNVSVDFDHWKNRYEAVRICPAADGGERGVPEADWAPQQNAAHCRTVANTNVYSIDPDSVASLIVYASSPQVKIRAEQGLGATPTYFSALDGEGPTLETSLKAACESVPPVRSDYEVDIVADELFARFRDVDGSKARVHRARIEREGKLRLIEKCA